MILWSDFEPIIIFQTEVLLTLSANEYSIGWVTADESQKVGGARF